MLQDGLSIRRLAKELGIDQSTLARWEKGESKPNLKHFDWEIITWNFFPDIFAVMTVTNEI
ncbi:MAG: multiprotein-bridging factor 1 family protein [Bacteroidota bacterium]